MDPWPPLFIYLFIYLARKKQIDLQLFMESMQSLLKKFCECTFYISDKCETFEFLSKSRLRFAFDFIIQKSKILKNLPKNFEKFAQKFRRKLWWNRKRKKHRYKFVYFTKPENACAPFHRYHGNPWPPLLKGIILRNFKFKQD